MGAATAYGFEEISSDIGVRQAEVELMHAAFPHATKYSYEYLRWEYDSNPFGSVVGFDAYLSNTLSAHYATQPMEARLFGAKAKGLLSFNTATHPDHQGHGLFTHLARRTYERAASLGYEFVVGVANQQSTPGFLSKLGFQLVAPLHVSVGFGEPSDQRGSDAEFERLWTVESRKWRSANPARSYYNIHGRIACSGDIPGAKVLLSSTDWSDCGIHSKSFEWTHPMTVWLGLPAPLRWMGRALPLPTALRPSPLNLIFLDLTSKSRTLDPARVCFNAIDFDAY